jgi:hypothetical protein
MRFLVNRQRFGKEYEVVLREIRFLQMVRYTILNRGCNKTILRLLRFCHNLGLPDTSPFNKNKMITTSIDSYRMFLSCPATKALKLAHEMNVPKARSTNFDVTLSSALFDLTFNDDLSAFPTLEWDSDGDFGSVASMQSLDTLNSLLGDDSMSALGKRGRSEARAAPRLVRSKKIKSDLASLAISISSRRWKVTTISKTKNPN